jgi:hypothetical protein
VKPRGNVLGAPVVEGEGDAGGVSGVVLEQAQEFAGLQQ